MSSDPLPIRPLGDNPDRRRALGFLSLFFLLIVLASWSFWGVLVWPIAGALAFGFLLFLRSEGPKVGPLFYYDAIRLARKGKTTLVRVGFLLILLLALWRVHQTWLASMNRRSLEPVEAISLNQHAWFAEQFVYNLLIVQNVAVFLLTPIYVAGTLTEERERRTMDLLFTTHLSDWEIVLGKLFSRLLSLGGVLLSGLPVLAFIQFWGGIDIPIVAANFALTAGNLFAVGALCMWVSSSAMTTVQSVLVCYGLLISTLTCVSCMNFDGFSPFLLTAFENRPGSLTEVLLRRVFVANLFAFGGGMLAILLCVFSLRDMTGEPFSMLGQGLAAPETAVVAKQPEATSKSITEALIPDPQSSPAIPIETDHPLLWKELRAAGPSWTRSPFVLGPFLLIFLPFGLVVLVGNLVGWLGTGDQHARQEIVQGIVALGRVFFVLLTGLGCLGAAFFAAGSVTRECERQTLDSLLTLPCNRQDILNAKWLASLLHGRGWLYIVAILALIDMLFVNRSLALFLLRLTAPIIHLLFVACLGIFFSVTSRTTVQAYLKLTVTLALVTFAPDVADYLWSYRGGSRLSLLNGWSPPYLWSALSFIDGNPPHLLTQAAEPARASLILVVYLSVAWMLWVAATLQWKWKHAV